MRTLTGSKPLSALLGIWHQQHYQRWARKVLKLGTKLQKQLFRKMFSWLKLWSSIAIIMLRSMLTELKKEYSQGNPGDHVECGSAPRGLAWWCVSVRRARLPGSLGLLAATETSRQHPCLSQTTHCCDSKAQRGSCIAHLNATIMSESV